MILRTVWNIIYSLWNAPGCTCNSNQGRKPCVCYQNRIERSVVVAGGKTGSSTGEPPGVGV